MCLYTFLCKQGCLQRCCISHQPRIRLSSGIWRLDTQGSCLYCHKGPKAQTSLCPLRQPVAWLSQEYMCQSVTVRRVSAMRFSGSISSVVWRKRPPGPYFPSFCCRSFPSWWSLAGITTSQTSLSCTSTEENRMAWWSVTFPTGRQPTLGSTIRYAPLLKARSLHAQKVKATKTSSVAEFWGSPA